MLQHLTAYFIQYKTVCLPGVGCFRLVEKPAQYNVVDRLMEPPTFLVESVPAEDITPHQLHFLHTQTGWEKEEVERELGRVMKGLQNQQSADDFLWSRLAAQNADSTVAIPVAAFQALPAERVIRQDAAHKVLVGDRQVTGGIGTEEAELTAAGNKTRSVLATVAWVLLVLSILFIAVWLYLGKFKINAAGSKLPPSAFVRPNAGRFTF